MYNFSQEFIFLFHFLFILYSPRIRANSMISKIKLFNEFKMGPKTGNALEIADEKLSINATITIAIIKMVFFVFFFIFSFSSLDIVLQKLIWLMILLKIMD